MENEKETSTLILVRVFLQHPMDKDASAEMNFIFDEQPNIDDIMNAYASDPYWAKNEDRDAYGGIMAQCLRTHGVPRLGKFKLTDGEDYTKAVPSIGATWLCNIVGRHDSVSNASFGSIRLTYKELRISTPVESVKAEAPKKAKTPTSRESKAARMPRPPSLV